MKLPAAIIIATLLTGCDLPQTETAPDNASVGRTILDKPEINIVTARGETLSVSCSAGGAFVYVDTKRAASKVPPLHGVYGTFTVDGRKLPPTELGWGSQPPSAWTAHDRNPTKPLALAIARAHTVTFEAPRDFDTGRPISWKIDLDAGLRRPVVEACE